jgi:hypothetical protein
MFAAGTEGQAAFAECFVLPPGFVAGTARAERTGPPPDAGF